MANKIGVGIVTYNAPDKIQQSAWSVQGPDVFVIVNDGTPYAPSCYPPGAQIIQHPTNLRVAAAKNSVLRHLMAQNCDHLFVMEDDVIIRDPRVFSAYIGAGEESGILHFNFGLQGPLNHVRPWLSQRLALLAGGVVRANREFDHANAEPNPRGIAIYPSGLRIALYPAICGAFSYFHRSAIEKIGFMDERFKNAWEHIEHTYRAVQHHLHPPFGWFADLENSSSYLTNIADCMSRSNIANSPDAMRNHHEGRKLFESIHGNFPDRIQSGAATEVADFLVRCCIASTNESQRRWHCQIAQSHQSVICRLKRYLAGRQNLCQFGLQCGLGPS